ncbi:hypothetical protein ABTM14_19610 [Acinetobacter baumannii]
MFNLGDTPISVPGGGWRLAFGHRAVVAGDAIDLPAGAAAALELIPEDAG